MSKHYSEFDVAPNVIQLDASTNMLHSIPMDIRKFDQLSLLNVSRNPLTQTEFSGLPTELSRLPHLRVLFLSECNLTSVPGVVWRCRRLEVLDIGRNKIRLISSEIGGLSDLRYLNAQYTGVRTLPSEIALCQKMREIVLWGNPIETLPSSLKHLENLRHLVMNFHNLGSHVETHMIGLIRKGQLQSEHIPRVVFQLPSLESLNLEETWINSLPEQGRANFKAFNISRNCLRSVPKIVLGMDKLAVLDISGNQISTLPPEIGQLRNLNKLLLNRNELEVIPEGLFGLERLQELDLGWNHIRTISSSLGCLTTLAKLVLNNNSIECLPKSIGNLTRLVTLDLSDNSLQRLPTSMYNMTCLKVAHTHKDLERVGLWLCNNPLRIPPENVWRCCDMTILNNYLKNLEIKSVRNLNSTKLILLGSEGCGKSSLVRCLTCLRPSLMGASSAASSAEVILWKTKNNVPFVIYDISGVDIYRTIRSLVLDRRATYLIVFDESSFTVDGFEHSVGKFLDQVLAHAPEAVVKLVGTKCDLMSHEQADADKQTVLELSKLHLKERAMQLTKFREDIKNGDLHVAEELQHLLPPSKGNRDYEIKLLSDVSMVSSKSLRGIRDLISEMESLAVSRCTSSTVRPPKLDRWMEFGKAIKRNQKGIYTEMQEILNLATETGTVNTSDVIACLQFLSDIGMVFWFPRIRHAAHLVFARCNTFLRLLRHVFRPSVSSVWGYKPHDVFDVVGRLDKATFAQANNLMFTNGIVSKQLLRALCFDLRPKNNLESIVDVLQKLDLAYAPVYPLDFYNSDQQPCLVLPSFNTETSRPEVEAACWPARLPDNRVEIRLIFEYTPLCPLDLFERLSCRIQSLVVKRFDWAELIVGCVDSRTTLAVRKKTMGGSAEQRIIEIVVRGVDRMKIDDTVDRLTVELGQLQATYDGIVFTANLFTYG